jgi:hypothetical protein
VLFIDWPWQSLYLRCRLFALITLEVCFRPIQADSDMLHWPALSESEMIVTLTQ